MSEDHSHILHRNTSFHIFTPTQHKPEGLYYKARLMGWVSLKPEFSVSQRYIAMVTDAEHITWSGGGYVQSFRLKSAINSAALTPILLLMSFLCRTD